MPLCIYRSIDNFSKLFPQALFLRNPSKILIRIGSFSLERLPYDFIFFSTVVHQTYDLLPEIVITTKHKRISWPRRPSFANIILVDVTRLQRRCCVDLISLSSYLIWVFLGFDSHAPRVDKSSKATTRWPLCYTIIG